MRKIRIIIAILVPMLACSIDASSQWTHSAASIGTTILCFANVGSTLFAGTLNDASGVWISTDHGASWKPKPSSLYNVSLLVGMGTNLFALAESPTGLQRSTNFGDSWTDLSATFPPDAFITSLVTDGTKLVASDSLGRFFLSMDTGAHWTKTNDGTLGHQAIALCAAGSSQFAKNDTGVFRSTDHGAHWSSFLTPVSAVSITSIGTDLFVLTHTIALHTSDNGLHWDTSAVPGTILVADGSTLVPGYLGNSSQASMSTDRGRSWTQLGYVYGRLIALCASGPNFVAGTINMGFWYHPIQPSSVHQNAMTHPDPIAIFPNPTTGLVAVTNAGEGVLQATVTNIVGEVVNCTRGEIGASCILDLSKLPVGTYLARIEAGDEIVSKKIVKE